MTAEKGKARPAKPSGPPSQIGFRASYARTSAGAGEAGATRPEFRTAAAAGDEGEPGVVADHRASPPLPSAQRAGMASASAATATASGAGTGSMASRAGPKHSPIR